MTALTPSRRTRDVAATSLSDDDIKAQIAFHRDEQARLEALLLAPTIARRVRDKLTATSVARLRHRKLHSDGLGLYLDLRHWPSRSWQFRFAIDGQRREMGLGPVSQVTLAEARAKRDAARKLVKAGIDPIDQRLQQQRAHRAEKVKLVTFQQCAEGFIAAHGPSWRSDQYRIQYGTQLEQHVYPVIGGMAVKDIDTPAVLRVLQPIWTTKASSAGRIRHRIEAVLDWAKVAGHRSGENPARWKAHLDHLLPSPAKVTPTVHLAAMPYRGVPAFMDELAAKGSISALALQFTVLTACRLGEMRGAVWEEFNLETEVWTIPASRMKAGREHRVPLSAAAMSIVERMRQLPRKEKDKDRVFPTGESTVLRHAQARNCTVHGFRSAFRDWAAEMTTFPSEVVEMALAHSVGTAVEQAYRRTDYFARRRQLADAWAAYVTSPAAAETVVPLARRI
jgi:integrase